MSCADWEKCCEKPDMSESTFHRLRKKLKHEGRAFLSELDGLWCAR